MIKKKTGLIIVVTVAALVFLSLLVLFFSRLVPKDTSPQYRTATEGTLSQSPADESQIDDQGTVIATDIEGEYKHDSGSDTLPDTPPPSLLDMPGVYPASGEFVLGGVPEGVGFDLSENADRYAAIVAAIKGAEPDFSPEGYVAEEHIAHHDENRVPDHGNVRVTLYIGDIETSSSCHVNIDGSTIQLVSIKNLYHPTPDKLGQIVQLRSDFEASSAARAEVERVSASLWPNAEGTESYEYSEEYYFDFASDRLYLYVNDNRWVGEYEMRRREPRYGCIDVQEVLGR